MLTVSPELTLRPLLSEVALALWSVVVTGVAGANAPAFVERSNTSTWPTSWTRCVAGANAPAFVERSPTPPWATDSRSCRRS